MRRKSFFSLSGTVVAVFCAIGLAIGVGWILNIIELVQSAGGNVTGMFVLRAIGIFIPPLGAVLGYI